METICEIIWDAAGRPVYISDTHGNCVLCGAKQSAGRSADILTTKTFTGYGASHAGSVLCQACQFLMDESSVMLQERTGRDRPQKMRSYSHIVDDDGTWHPMTKAQKTLMLALLRQSPMAVVISDTGQKHIAYRAVPGWWQFEEQRIAPDLPMLDRMLGPIQGLYNAGFGKAEISSGRYDSKRIGDYGITPWQALESQIASWRGSPLFHLAVWFAQKKGEENGSSDDSI